jgi:hypothetical protein
MVAEKIDGTQIAKDIRAGLKNEIQKIQNINPRFKPSLVIFQGTSAILQINVFRGKVLTLFCQVGDRSDSSESSCGDTRWEESADMSYLQAHMCA